MVTNVTCEAPDRPNRRIRKTKDQQQKDPDLHVRFHTTQRHSRSRPGLPPPSPSPRTRPAHCPPAFALEGFFVRAAGPRRGVPADRLGLPCVLPGQSFAVPRLGVRPAFFSLPVTQETAAPARPWHDLPIESTTGPTLPDRSPPNSTLLIALVATYLLPHWPLGFPPRGAFSLRNPPWLAASTTQSIISAFMRSMTSS